MAAQRSVTVIPFTEDPLRVLVLRRPPERAAGWQPVSGRVEPEDATLAAACVREIAEETDLPAPLEVLDLDAESSFTGYDGRTYRQRHFAARYADAHPVTRTPEHEEARWLPADDAAPLLAWAPDREALALLRKRLGA